MNQPAQTIVREEPARFTVSEFDSMAAGLVALDLADRIELVDGVITRMPPPLRPHAYWTARVSFLLQTALLNSQLQVLADVGLELDRDTLRQPDILVLNTQDLSRSYVAPGDVLLAVEVADSTLPLDMGPRKLRFARAGVPHYWVVDVEGGRVHLFAEPRDGDYARHDEQPLEAELPVPGTDHRISLAPSA
jgi:Uma2 family endonuclease